MAHKHTSHGESEIDTRPRCIGHRQAYPDRLDDPSDVHHSDAGQDYEEFAEFIDEVADRELEERLVRAMISYAESSGYWQPRRNWLMRQLASLRRFLSTDTISAAIHANGQPQAALGAGWWRIRRKSRAYLVILLALLISVGLVSHSDILATVTSGDESSVPSLTSATPTNQGTPVNSAPKRQSPGHHALPAFRTRKMTASAIERPPVTVFGHLYAMFADAADEAYLVGCSLVTP